RKQVQMRDLVDRVKQLYAIAEELTRETGRSFRPDGHMVGSAGEVMAAHLYGLRLLPQSTAGHDAKKGSRAVQIKATGGDRVALYSEPQHLLVLKLEGAKPSEIFNGPG